MSGAITQAIYMGVGASGAMTDVSTYVDLEAGIDYQYGRDSEFDDAGPGTFSFTVDNATGRFTPDNTASAYATTVTEGMQVCWQAGARLVAGSVIGIEPAFPGDDAAWAQVVITCDDMLGVAARVEVDQSLPYTVAVQNADMFFPLNEPAGTGVATNLGSVASEFWMQPYGAVAVTFGVDGETGLFASQVDLSVAAATSAIYYATDQAPLAGGDVVDALSTPYTVGMWVTPINTTGYLRFSPASPVTTSFAWGIQNGAFMYYKRSTTTWVNVGGFIPGEPHFVEITVTSSASTMYIDGVQVATDTSAHVFVPALHFLIGDAAYGATDIRVAQLTVSDARLGIEGALASTEAARLALLDSASTAITFNTLPAGLSTALVAPDDGAGSVLDKINAVIRAEQGQVYTSTTGTVSSPTQAITVRERDRPVTVTETFDVEDEGTGSPSIIRDVTNLAAAATINGPLTSIRVSDTDLLTRTTATVSEDVILAQANDLKAWGEDRLIRGANTNLRVQTVTIDAFTTPTARSADLLALVPGDRIQLTDFPSTVLGFTTWDGWLLGAEEHHGLGVHEFTLKLQPVLDADPIYDTDRYMSDGAVTLNANINSSVTSIVYATTAPEMEATAVPYDIVIGSENITVTAVNTGTNTLTVTRGANGTTAAAHTAADPIEILDDAFYAF